VQTRRNVRRLAGTLALVTAGGGLAAACTPTAPTATLANGTVTVTGTPAGELITVRIGDDQLRVDFGFDGTVDVQFPRAQVNRLEVLAGEGDDSVLAADAGVGFVDITLTGAGGNDHLAIVADNRLDGVRGDATSTVNGGAGNDDIEASVPNRRVFVDAGAGDDRVEGRPPGRGPGFVEASLGAGNDVYTTDLNNHPDGRGDFVDGGDGRDTLEGEGTIGPDQVEMAGVSTQEGDFQLRGGPRSQARGIDVEVVKYFGFGSRSGPGDTVTVKDLFLVFNRPQFVPVFGSGRGALETTPNTSPDTLIVQGSVEVDEFRVGGQTASNIFVDTPELLTSSALLQPEDSLVIDTLEGNDLVDSSSLVPGLVQFTVR
jgi:hypothetical protein